MVSSVIFRGKKYSTYGSACSLPLPFYSWEKGSNRVTYTVAYLLRWGPWKALCSLRTIHKMIGFMLWTIKPPFAHTHEMCIHVCKYHSNDNVKCPSLKFILTFLNSKLLCTHTNILQHFIVTNKAWHTHFFIRKFYFMWRKKMYKRKLYIRSGLLNLCLTMYEEQLTYYPHEALCNPGSNCCFTWNVLRWQLIKAFILFQ
jgi:hypothetical protein